MPAPLISLSEAKAQLQLASDDSSRDSEVAGFLFDAMAWVERRTGHILVARDVTEQFYGFDRLQLAAWPVLPTAVPAVAYADPTGTPVGVAGARIDVSKRPARVLPALGSRWPGLPRSSLTTVTIRAGYEATTDVPRNLRRAILILIAGYDADREGGDVLAKAEASARRLTDSFRMRRL